MIGLSLCTFCAFVKERWCRKQIRPFCNLVVIVIIITHNNPIWEVLLITSQVFKSPKTKKDLGPRWLGPSSSLSPSPFLMLRYVLMLLKPKWQSSSRIWSQSRSLFCHQSASCDHSQPTNTVQIQSASANTFVQTQTLVTTVSQPMQCTLQDVLDMDQSSRGVSDSGFTWTSRQIHQLLRFIENEFLPLPDVLLVFQLLSAVLLTGPNSPLASVLCRVNTS